MAKWGLFNITTGEPIIYISHRNYGGCGRTYFISKEKLSRYLSTSTIDTRKKVQKSIKLLTIPFNTKPTITSFIYLASKLYEQNGREFLCDLLVDYGKSFDKGWLDISQNISTYEDVEEVVKICNKHYKFLLEELEIFEVK